MVVHLVDGSVERMAVTWGLGWAATSVGSTAAMSGYLMVAKSAGEKVAMWGVGWAVSLVESTAAKSDPRWAAKWAGEKAAMTVEWMAVKWDLGWAATTEWGKEKG